MEKSTLYGVIIFLIILVGGWVFLKSEGNINGNVVDNSGNGEVQEITLSVKNGNYYPQEVSVKSGRPVRIYLDNSVGGCLRSFTIRDFGIAKNLPTPQDYVEFTPTVKGSHTFACSMGMGTGRLIVE